MMNERAVSPVVATALLLAITALLATTVGLGLFDLGAEGVEEPEVTLSFGVEDDDIVLQHEGGEQLEADEVVVLDEDGNELSPGLENDLTAGESEVVVDNATGVDQISVVWEHPRSGTGSILGTFKP